MYSSITLIAITIGFTSLLNKSNIMSVAAITSNRLRMIKAAIGILIRPVCSIHSNPISPKAMTINGTAARKNFTAYLFFEIDILEKKS
jgi:hypothetical protein